MVASLNVVTLNVEGHKHINLIREFLLAEKPQVLCLQEVFKVDLPLFASCLGEATSIHFVPTLVVDRPNDFNFAPLGEYGVAIVSSLPLKNLRSAVYVGDANAIPLINDRNSNNPNRVVIWADVVTDAGALRIATTHFTWSPDGQACFEQTQSLQTLLAIYQQQIKTGLFCGDFNAPRGGDIYQALAARFTDNIPTTVATTLDSKFHRVSGLEFVVDYLFTTPEYSINTVRLNSGVSDHQALSAQLNLL